MTKQSGWQKYKASFKVAKSMDYAQDTFAERRAAAARHELDKRLFEDRIKAGMKEVWE